MRLFLKTLIIGVILLLAAYSVIWFIALNGVVKGINLHAGQNIDIQRIIKQPYSVKFSKAYLSGFPFKLIIRIENFEEENNNSKTQYLDPLYIGYDLLKQRFFLNHSGQVLSFYKPLQSGFGSKIHSKGLSLYVDFPINFKLVKLFTSKTRNSFELVNFINNLKIVSGKIEVFDLVGEEKIYEQGYSKTIFNVINHREYKTLEEFIKDIPKKLNIELYSKINFTSRIDKKITPYNLFYNFYIPFSCDQTHKISLSTGSKDFDNINSDYEINVKSFFNSERIKDFNSDIAYKNFGSAGANNLNLNINSQFNLEKGIVDDIFLILGYLSNFEIKNPIIIKFQDELGYIIENRNKLTLGKLENKQYNINIELKSNQSKDQIEIIADNFEIFASANQGLGKESIVSKNFGEENSQRRLYSGIKLKGECKINHLNLLLDEAQTKAQGDIIIFNYNSFANFLLENLFALNKYTKYSNDQAAFNKEVLLSFIKSISDYPNSTAPDVSFKYDIDFQDAEAGTLGSVTPDKLAKLYNIALYKKIIETLSESKDFDTKIDSIAPTLTAQEREFLKQLTLNPKNIDPGLWQNLIEQ